MDTNMGFKNSTLQILIGINIVYLKFVITFVKTIVILAHELGKIIDG